MYTTVIDQRGYPNVENCAFRWRKYADPPTNKIASATHALSAVQARRFCAIKEIAHRIDDNVPFAAFHFLAGIIPPFATRFSGLDTLAIDDRGTWLAPAESLVVKVALLWRYAL